MGGVIIHRNIGLFRGGIEESRTSRTSEICRDDDGYARRSFFHRCTSLGFVHSLHRERLFPAEARDDIAGDCAVIQITTCTGIGLVSGFPPLPPKT